VLWVIDFDGVVWLSGRPIAGSAEAIDKLRSAGEKVAFVTNNSGPTLEQYVKRLHDAGIKVQAGEIVTSAHAAATLLRPGSRVFPVGGPGLREALVERGLELVAPSESPAAVVVGRSTEVGYPELAAATAAIRRGARFIATNTDATFPTPSGPEPGAGAFVAFLETASGRKAEVAGKPAAPAAALVVERFGKPGLVVGDRAETDGSFAERLGAPFALVLSGVTARSDLPVVPEPCGVYDDLAAVVESRLEGTGAGDVQR
jgi:glycerol 3-phosphatase-2